MPAKLNIVTIEDLDAFQEKMLAEMKKLLIEHLAPKPDNLLKGREVCKQLNISRGSLSNMVKKKEIEHIEIRKNNYKYTQEAIDKFKKKGRNHPASLSIIIWWLLQAIADCSLDGLV